MASNDLTKNDMAWQKIFDKYNILNEINKNGIYKISAKQIKEFREPRLMTKFDWSASKPKIFAKNNLSILPDSRGTYIIGSFNAYVSLEHMEQKPQLVNFPEWLRTFDELPITSESYALNIAQFTGMIDIVLNEDNEYPAFETINGRLKSGKIDFNIMLNDKKSYKTINVNNSQIEIDASFENIEKIAIIEAKNKIPKDFIVRQLYYPYRMYKNLVPDKPIIPIYFTHVDDIYSFHIYCFDDDNDYSSIRKINQLDFIVDITLDISLEDIKDISYKSKNDTYQDKNSVFPQANNFTVVLNSLSIINEGTKSDKELAKEINYDKRQGGYYGNALVYLQLATKENHRFKITKLGKKIAKLPNSNTRNKIIIQQILSNKSFNLIFQDYLKSNNRHNIGEFDNDLIINTILSNTNVISDDVAKRRSQTVKAWISWIINVAVGY